MVSRNLEVLDGRMDEVEQIILYFWSILIHCDLTLCLQTALKYFLHYVISTDIVRFLFLRYQVRLPDALQYTVQYLL